MKELLIVLALLAVVVVAYRLVRKVETYDDPILKQIQENLIRVDIRAKNLSFSGSTQSFTEDKKRTYLCLKDERGQYYDINMLMYVALHELAHAISTQVDVDHTTNEFKTNFNMLLAKAADLGVYDPKLPLNYNYCPKTEAIAKQNGGADLISSATGSIEQTMSIA